jgi:hypothetical protein
MFLELAMAYDIVTAANCLTKRNQILCNLEIRLNSRSLTPREERAISLLSQSNKIHCTITFV